VATIGLLVVMVAQAALGLILRGQYRDVEWIQAAWFGNDWVTLLVVAPALAAAFVHARRGSARAQLVWLGGLGYAAYNYAYYLLGAALNAFFPLYVAALVLSSVALIRALPRVDLADLAARLDPRGPLRLIAAYLAFVGSGLGCVWLGMWAAYVFAGRPTPIEPEAFKLVAALDLAIMVPLLLFGAALLWRQDPWGPVVAAIASIQGALYLLVLAVNSWVAIRRGLAEAPGELPVWGTLTVCTTAAAALLLTNVRRRPVLD
jgi:hypothetical protein